MLLLSRHQRPEHLNTLFGGDDIPRGLGYLLMERTTAQDLVDAILRIASGDCVVDAEVVESMIDNRGHSPLDSLSAREREILELMVQGRTNSAIAERLHLTSRTVAGTVAGISRKLGLQDDPDAHRRLRAALAYLRAEH